MFHSEFFIIVCYCVIHSVNRGVNSKSTLTFDFVRRRGRSKVWNSFVTSRQHLQSFAFVSCNGLTEQRSFTGGKLAGSPTPLCSIRFLRWVLLWWTFTTYRVTGYVMKRNPGWGNEKCGQNKVFLAEKRRRNVTCDASRDSSQGQGWDILIGILSRGVAGVWWKLFYPRKSFT